MTDPIVRQLLQALQALAMPAEEQLKRVGTLGVGLDELALEFDDVAAARRKLVAETALSAEQADAVGAVERQLKAMSAAGPSRWTADAARTGEDWREVRRLSELALQALR